MNVDRKTVAMGIAVACLAGACTTVQIDPVDADTHRLGRVCIEKNHRVLVPALVPAIRDSFRRNGVKTEVRAPQELEDCRYVLRYTALRGWDIGTYTRVMKIEIWEGERSIGGIDYEHHGGLAVTKYARTADKLDPLVDQLLEGQKP